MGTLAVRDLGTILGVWAHPDDETYLSAGIMALARRNGQRVVCVTATRGEQGADDPIATARLRERELEAALAAVGVEEHVLLDHDDGACATADPATAMTEIAGIVRDVRPDTILTFGPDGITGHADHRAVSHWVTSARRCAAPEASLLYAAVPLGHDEDFRDVHEALSVYEPGFPIEVPEEALALTVVVEGWVLDRKDAALGAHASQTAGVRALLGDDRYRAWWALEAFRAA